MLSLENQLDLIIKLRPQGRPNAPVLQQWALTNARVPFYLPIRSLVVSASKLVTFNELKADLLV